MTTKSQNITCNPNKGIDYHLNLLGLVDRKDWDIYASDDQLFVGSTIRCRPDWVIINVNRNTAIVLEYKNRILGNGNLSATPYELAEVTANTLCVEEVLEEQYPNINVSAVLMYGDNQKLHVEYNDEDVNTILYTAMEFTQPGRTITSSELARTITSERSTAFNNSLAKAGIEAHKALQSYGPKIEDMTNFL